MKSAVQNHDGIYFGALEMSELSSFLLKFKENKKIIIVDENTHDHCLEYVLTTFEELKDAEIMLLPCGEENKVMEVCFQVWQAMSEYEIGRGDLVINLGGGVVTDMGGFIAAVYKRGVDFINIPTTLLGMVDAAIGGKTGIDLGPFKNQIGVFKHAVYTIVDPCFLQTLNEKEYLNGYAEILKHALIADQKLWKSLVEKDLQSVPELELIREAANIKLNIVSEDPFEKGPRKLLNFGHTIGHALEGYFLNSSPMDHGFAVALGIIAESYISLQRKMISEGEFQEITHRILPLFPIPAISENSVSDIVQLCRNDKKNTSGRINCVLLNGIGNADYNSIVYEHELTDALNYLRSLSR
ncbi:MAG: 3-dehydroquinate synthase [Cryomorphaceae bacterium]|jgi:3-dehydroquinate synthase|nr:3-dehydroquinate synthase [Cryomorphaceae bacterium]